MAIEMVMFPETIFHMTLWFYMILFLNVYGALGSARGVLVHLIKVIILWIQYTFLTFQYDGTYYKSPENSLH